MATKRTLNNIIAGVRATIDTDVKFPVVDGHALIVLKHLGDILREYFPGNVEMTHGKAVTLLARIDTIMSLSAHYSPTMTHVWDMVMALNFYVRAADSNPQFNENSLDRANFYYNRYLADNRQMVSEKSNTRISA
jgi:hypothetical protein